MTRSRNLLLMALALVLAGNLVIGYRVYSAETARTGEDEAFEKVGVMMQVLQLIRKDYVSSEKVSYHDLIYNAMQGMVRSLDPFSDFMPPEEYDAMVENTEGEFGGLGIIVSMKDDVLTIVAPIDGTPGSQAGLLAGDQIVRIEGESTEGIKLDEAIGKMRGAPGTKVTLTIRRPDSDAEREVTITRAVIPVHSVAGARRLAGGRIGYVRLTQFNDPTADELRQAVEGLESEGIEALIIDLRNNPGGLLTSAVEICSYFLEPNTLIVSTEGRQPSQKQEFRTQRRGYRFPRKPLALLINGGSASAAEIMAGCLKDWERAVLIGEKTFGKGSVQNVIPLPDGSALRLTTAMYYTPSRRVIHEHGVEPDVEVKLGMDQYRAIFEAQEGLRPDGDAADPQLQRAIEILQSGEARLKAVPDKADTTDADTAAESADQADSAVTDRDSADKPGATTEGKAAPANDAKED